MSLLSEDYHSGDPDFLLGVGNIFLSSEKPINISREIWSYCNSAKKLRSGRVCMLASSVAQARVLRKEFVPSCLSFCLSSAAKPGTEDCGVVPLYFQIQEPNPHLPLTDCPWV